MIRDKNLAFNRATRRLVKNNRAVKYIQSQQREAAKREQAKKK